MLEGEKQLDRESVLACNHFTSLKELLSLTDPHYLCEGKTEREEGLGLQYSADSGWRQWGMVVNAAAW